MISFYIVASAVILLILNGKYNIFAAPYSWWLVPVSFAGLILAFIILQLLIFVISIAVSNKNAEKNRFGKYYRWLTNITVPILFKLGRVKIEITGKEKIPENKRVMLVCNHIHDFDPAVILAALPELELGFIAKKEVYDIFPFVAKLMSKLDCLPIDRENNREGVKAILKAVSYIKSDRASIGIFPEGYTSLDGNLHEFRNGAFKIATKAKCPIVVTTLVNSNEIVKNMFRRKTVVYFDVLDVITEEETAVLKTEEIGERAHKLMSENINKRRENQKTAAD